VVVIGNTCRGDGVGKIWLESFFEIGQEVDNREVLKWIL
jgi:hypothetical protein